MNPPVLTSSSLRYLFVALAGSASALSPLAVAQPANDAPTAAQPIAFNDGATGTTIQATASTTATVPIVCNSNASAPDVWFQYDALTNQNVQFSLCRSSSWNSVMAVYARNPDGTPGALIACDDDGCALSGHASVAAQTVVGSSYLIRITGRFSTSSGAFTLVTEPALNQTPLVRSVGTDAIIGEISDAQQYGTRTVDGQLLRSFGIGTRTWNIGDRPLAWTSSTNNHPAWGQNLYRSVGTRFEQIGQGWLKHGFAVANGTFNAGFGTCTTSGISSTLGVNCSDPYGAGTNASQSRLGPKFDINPTTGAFTFPFTNLIPALQSGDNVFRRLQARDVDVQPASNPGARYWGEAYFFGPDDSSWGNSFNNYGSREFAPFPTLNPTGSSSLPFQSPSLRATAIELFAQRTPGVKLSDIRFHERDVSFVDPYNPWTVANPQVTLRQSPQNLTMPAQSRFIIASSATAQTDGTWIYNYAVMNVNSHRAMSQFVVRTGANAQVTQATFFAPPFHSGDRYVNTPWDADMNAGTMDWTVTNRGDTSTFVVGSPAQTVTLEPNALIFGTTYSYSFRSASPPTTGAVRLKLYRAPHDATGYQGDWLLASDATVPTVCLGDIGSQGGLPGPDGSLDNNDFAVFINAFFNSDLPMADLGSTGGITAPDNRLDNNDFAAFIDVFFVGCL